jgi:hypothetical protein
MEGQMPLKGALNRPDSENVRREGWGEHRTAILKKEKRMSAKALRQFLAMGVALMYAYDRLG